MTLVFKRTAGGDTYREVGRKDTWTTAEARKHGASEEDLAEARGERARTSSNEHLPSRAGVVPPAPEPGSEDRNGLVDWSTIWGAVAAGEDWLVEPLLPARRATVTYSPAGAGKSLLALDVAVRLATGARVLARPAGAPAEVLYLDFEQTEDDLIERLAAMGYGPESELSHLRYYLLPSLPPLDTAEGGAAVIALARKYAAVLVVIDTTARVISGGENDADTFLGLYRHTIMPLKAEGRAVWRLDHAGKDLERGQRGSSAKRDDVDAVFELTAGDENTVRLRATKRRQSWIPEYIDLVKLEDPDLQQRQVVHLNARH